MNSQPAFPEAGLAGLPSGEFIHGRSGMTMLQYYAAEAMKVLILTPPYCNKGSFLYSDLAICSFNMAAAMIAEGERRMNI